MRRCAIFAGLCLALAFACSAGGMVIYVDANAPLGGDGKSWATAYRYLQDALADANAALKPAEVWVGQGVYEPDQGVGQTKGDRTASFQLLDDVSIKGGFVGLGAPDPNARDVKLYETILSGDLATNDKDVNDPCDLLNEPTRAENSYHVLSALYTSETAAVDGFTITGGNANYSQYRRSRGGALWCWFALPTVRDCVIRQNSAWDYGGAIAECGKVEHCVVTHNYARGQGGGLFRCGPVWRCAVTYNSAGTHGGGISYCESITDCVVSHNSARMTGGGVAGTDFFTSRAMGCVITANIAEVGGGIAYCGIVGNCVIAGNRANKGAGLYNCPGLTSCSVTANKATGLGGGMYVPGGNVVVSNSILWANIAAEGNEVALSGSCAVADTGPGGEVIVYCSSGSISLRYSNVQDGAEGIYRDFFAGEVEWVVGNLNVDPCFADPGYWDPHGTPGDANDDFFVEGDYHLKSQAGRWDPNTAEWILDEVTSPCIDAGDPNDLVGLEPFPNGGRINMGAYGATIEASKSCSGPPAAPSETREEMNAFNGRNTREPRGAPILDF